MNFCQGERKERLPALLLLKWGFSAPQPPALQPRGAANIGSGEQSPVQCRAAAAARVCTDGHWGSSGLSPNNLKCCWDIFAIGPRSPSFSAQFLFFQPNFPVAGFVRDFFLFIAPPSHFSLCSSCALQVSRAIQRPCFCERCYPCSFASL